MLFLAQVALTASPLRCGLATTQFAQNTPTLVTAVGTKKLSFWWNWATTPSVDTAELPAPVTEAMNKRFVPMLWGQAPLANYDFLKGAQEVMGYNEPDLYGPACCNCDGKQSYYPATSSGWLALFNPASAAHFWRDTVNNLTSHAAAKSIRIVSPSMANGAKPVAGVDCTLDPAIAGHPKRCEGWLSLFKAASLQLECTRFDGTTTNCWDVIGAIQIHAYAKTAAEVLQKIDGYLEVFADDVVGKGGRSKKVLWLTEVAAASNDQAEIVPFVNGLMSTQGGLGDRVKYAAVERVSWFSEWFFTAFNVSGHTVRPNERWASSLFLPFGGLSEVGTAFFENCAEV